MARLVRSPCLFWASLLALNLKRKRVIMEINMDSCTRMLFDIQTLRREREAMEEEIRWINMRLNALEGTQLIEKLHLLIRYMSIADINDTWKACEKALLKALESSEVSSQLKQAVIWQAKHDYDELFKKGLL
ncbi:hypothetical protein THIOM_001773 [Candidatus Thiomargarita nelsonii]|uniref:Uncharacterized protein n=1 Tax=Candidatus Thiomargarita nelsonii TaxID=1003181 RepID=A0A176S3A6_9GAMM|nr:hypothetical protein THIOM_001773 [Candidatus Thiomargarita nelsonii]